MHRGLWLGVAAGLAALLAAAGGAAAQDADEPLRPEVTFPDVELDERVVPLDDPGQAPLNATVSCRKAPLPVFYTTVTFDARAPSFANAIESPSSQALAHEPVACVQGTPLEAEATLSVSLTQNAPAFETVDLPVEATVQRSAGGPAPTSTWTETANATFTVGYFPLVNVRADEKIAEVAPGERHTYPVQVDSFSNGPTEIDLSVANASDGVEVSLPEPVVLAPNGTAHMGVELRDTTGQPGATHRVRLDVDGTSTDPRAVDSAHDEVSLLLDVAGEGDGVEPQGADGADRASAPAPAAGLALAALVVAGAALRRA